MNYNLDILSTYLDTFQISPHWIDNNPIALKAKVKVHGVILYSSTDQTDYVNYLKKENNSISTHE